MDEQKELIKKRGSIKGQLTLFTTYVNGCKDSPMTHTEEIQLQLRMGKIESLYQQYDEVQLQLECNSDNLDLQLTERSDFESKYFTSLAEAQEMLNPVNKKKDDFELCSDRGSHGTNCKQRLVKLPTIQLPKFHGSYENWLEFHDTFSSLIHSNDNIEAINKFHYLRASLEGSAALVVKSIEFSAKNYDIAWKLLCDRFNNKRLLLQNHVSALFNIEPITKESSVQLKRVIDEVNKNLRSLESLGEPVKHWDTLLIHIITHKLDTNTFREWEEHKGSLDKNSTILFETFLIFIRNRADLIETLEISRVPSTSQTSQPTNKHVSKHRTMLAAQTTIHTPNNSMPPKPCPKCNGQHSLNNCPQFLALSNADRLQLLPNYKVCYNCLRSGHYANHCKKTGCKVCKRKHHSLIHVAEMHRISGNGSTTDSSRDAGATAPATLAPAAHPSTSLTLAARVAPPSHSAHGQDVLLSTALIKLYDNDNRAHIVRAVLDCGSTGCILTEKMCKQLKLQTDCVDKSVVGINNITSHVSKTCRVLMKSLNEIYSTGLYCFVLPSITDDIPCHHIDLSNLNIPSDLCLADPNFHTPAAIDLIIGADVFWDLLGSQKITLGDGRPILFETRLGWLVSGPLNSGYTVSPSRSINCHLSTISSNGKIELINEDIQNQLTRFWQLDDVCPQMSHYSSEEKLCEEHFTANTTRLENGRFCVRLPLKQNPNILGESISRAKQCFLSLERRIESRSEFKQMYKEFMSEYRLLGHMSECRSIDAKHNAYFIPHHGVLRESSSTTKLRVVFNASSPTSSGVSLNNIQMVGPTVQDDLLSILLRFRQYRYILCADIEKMYRQIAVHPDDRYLQQIIWRDDPSDHLKAYQLNTVTYGTANAPFLATRCLKQVGLECDDEEIREIIVHDFYVDDLLTGGDNLTHVESIKCKVMTALKSACMNLRKWKSNEPQFMSDSNQSPLNLNIGTVEPSKTLGLGWQFSSDELFFPIGIDTTTSNTKRDMLSIIAQIFDPLGLLAPCVVLMKILLQKLWLQKLSWDEQLSPEIGRLWADIVRDLPALNTIHIPRQVLCNSYKNIECHVFTDASERAYGSCVYLRSTNELGEVLVRLLVAKSRVAPIKPTTIPRLELCGGLVGARLYEKVINSLRLHIRSTTFWTDSTILLGWLKMMPSRLQPFVRNRTAEILEKTGNCVWRHVPTDQNAADHITRGVQASSIQSLSIWWEGPRFLKRDPSGWPSNLIVSNALPETRPEVSLHANVQKNSVGNDFIDFSRFSTLPRLKRTAAYILRFVNSCKKQRPLTDYFTDAELKNATNLIIKLSQRDSFSEYQLLLDKQSLPKKSPLVKFNVFLDENNLMRVGGRLSNSDFLYEKKHPALIQSTHRFTQLLFQHEHKRLMHAPPQLLLAAIRDSYWPIGGTNLAKTCFHKCVKCMRMKGQVITPIMGNLPKSRILPSFPFDSVGVDYAGPLNAVSRQGRGCKVVKVYIALFICFTTKAVHLELVGDLTSNNYLMALRRFVSRRGKPTNIYSDNGTSFVGAYNDLSKFLKSNCNSLAEDAVGEDLNFHFIPAYSPHFGGLWEAGVKSTKFHLSRVLGNCHLTYEELNTVLVQVEAILNSRPLTPLSSDPADLSPLTPGHFLIGRPLHSLPGQDYRDNSTRYLTRYQRIEQLRQHFWSRWSKEYVSELQVRTKWRSGQDTLELDTLVLLKEDNLPPLKWKLGRIIAIHPGSDGISRVADVRTATGPVRRSFSKLCPLPVSSESG